MLKYATINVLTIVFAILIVILHIFYNSPLWLLSVVVLFWIVLTASGSGLIQWNYHLNAFISNPKIQKNQIAITFDDGPHAVFTPKVLALLERYNQKATFFCIGKQIAKNTQLFNEIINKGHVVGNHTYNHQHHFGFLKTEEVISELKQTTGVAKRVSGLTMQLYRPAFGVTNPRIKKAVTTLNLQAIGWNKRSLDTTNRSDSEILKRITHTLKRGDVILLHDTSEKSIRVLEQLLIFLGKQKMKSVTIDTLFQIKAYA